MEGIEELVNEIESLYTTIAEQAMEHIHAKEVILTYGQSLSMEYFLKTAAKKRSFEVIVVQSAPSYNAHDMASGLADAGIVTTVITDSSVYPMMARVNKVFISVEIVAANGGLIGQTGLHNIALAAKYHAVPLVCITGLFKLSPLYPHDLNAFNELQDPSAIFDFQSMTTQSESSIKVLNPVYDYVPPEYVSLFLTNIGCHQPSYVYRLLSEYYSPQDHQL